MDLFKRPVLPTQRKFRGAQNSMRNNKLSNNEHIYYYETFRLFIIYLRTLKRLETRMRVP